MSFILDALRKSEHERQRQGGPGIADLKPVAVAARLPMWAIALGALLLINIGVVLLLVLRGESAPRAEAPAGGGQTAPAAAPPAAAPSAGLASPPRAAQVAPDYALPPPVLPPSRPQSESAGYSRYEEAPRRDADPELNRAGPTNGDGTSMDAMTRMAAVGRTENPENLPTLNDVMLQGSGRVPELHLDIHVYSARPADRFVFINNRKYREGGETSDGTRIERITPDGVVLNHRGLRFLLPRQ